MVVVVVVVVEGEMGGDHRFLCTNDSAGRRPAIRSTEGATVSGPVYVSRMSWFHSSACIVHLSIALETAENTQGVGG